MVGSVLWWSGVWVLDVGWGDLKASTLNITTTTVVIITNTWGLAGTVFLVSYSGVLNQTWDAVPPHSDLTRSPGDSGTG